MYRAVVLVLPPVSVFETAIVAEVYGLDRTAHGVPGSRVIVCTPDGPATLPTKGAGFSMQVDHGLEALRRADLIIVPAWVQPFVERPTAIVIAELQRAHRKGTRIISFCSGAHVLASAGLLEGRRATTHWMHAAAMRAEHPHIEWDEDSLFIDDDSGICTSAGTAAGIDLCLHLLRKDHGADVANTVARRMVMPPHRVGSQAQYVETVPASTPGVEPPINAAMTWALRNLRHEVTVEAMARKAKTSPRTFARHFRSETGTTPLQWLLAQRVSAAQRLLETTVLPVERIAERVGLGTAANLRVHFHRVTGTSPQAYRRTFRGPLQVAS